MMQKTLTCKITNTVVCKQLHESDNLNVNCKVIYKLIHHIRDPHSVKQKTEIPQKITPGSMNLSWRELLCNQGLYRHD